MIRRPPRSTPLSLHDALPIYESEVLNRRRAGQGPQALAQIVGERVGKRKRVDQRPVHHRSEEHTSELQSRLHLVCRLLLEKKKKTHNTTASTATTREISETE